MHSGLWFWHTLIRDIYWCGIPLGCRECAFLEVCRKGFWQGRKCYHGCIKLNRMRQHNYEEDNWKSRLEEAEKHFSTIKKK